MWFIVYMCKILHVHDKAVCERNKPIQDMQYTLFPSVMHEIECIMYAKQACEIYSGEELGLYTYMYMYIHCSSGEILQCQYLYMYIVLTIIMRIMARLT